MNAGATVTSIRTVMARKLCQRCALPLCWHKGVMLCHHCGKKQKP